MRGAKDRLSRPRVHQRRRVDPARGGQRRRRRHRAGRAGRRAGRPRRRASTRQADDQVAGHRGRRPRLQLRLTGQQVDPARPGEGVEVRLARPSTGGRSSLARRLLQEAGRRARRPPRRDVELDGAPAGDLDEDVAQALPRGEQRHPLHPHRLARTHATASKASSAPGASGAAAGGHLEGRPHPPGVDGQDRDRADDRGRASHRAGAAGRSRRAHPAPPGRLRPPQVRGVRRPRRAPSGHRRAGQPRSP